MRLSRRRIAALSGAAVWLAVIGAAFAILSLVTLGTALSTGGLVAVVIAAAIVVTRAVAIMVVNPICVVSGRPDLIVPLDVLIVGAHFIPLARIFRVWRYYWLGFLFCGVAVGTLVLAPSSMQIGAASARYVLPALGCAPAAFVIAWGNLREASGSVAQWRETTVSEP